MRGRVHPIGELRQHAVDAVADLLSGHVAVLFELELHRDDSQPLVRGGAQLREPRDTANGLFQDLGDFRLYLRRGRAGVRHHHGHERDVDVGKAVHREAPDAGNAEHQEDQRHHPREHGARHGDAS
jgi:hypothetical protein